MRLEHKVVIARPPEVVFAFLEDPENLLRWQASVLKVKKLEDGRHVEVRAVLGKKFRQTLEVTANEPPRRLDYQVVDGPFPARLSHTLEPFDGGTRITVVGEGDPGGLRLGEPLLARVVRRQSRKDFARLKTLLETESA